MNNLTLRAITGTLFVLVVVGAIWYGPLSFALLLNLVIVGCLYEFYSLLMPGQKSWLRWYHILCGLAFFVFSTQTPPLHGRLLSGILLGLVFGSFIIPLFLKTAKPFEEIAYALSGWIYISVPFTCLYMMAGTAADYEFFKPLSVLIFIWTNDTFAYLIGRMIGKTPLFPRISPNKTIEGSLGGLLMVLVAAYVCSLYSASHSFAGWAGLGLVAAVFGALGDLVESMLKRSLNIKDSGKILPGHGGLLDRFDATLLAAPFVYAYLLIIS